MNNNLELLQYDDTIKFIPPITKAKVIKVYDGDTITIGCSLPIINKEDVCYRFSVRLRGIDSPEIKSKNEYEKEIAHVAKSMLSDKILNEMVILENIDYDKYGRLLADVIFEDKNMSEFMIENKLAIAYDGGTKNIDFNWALYRMTDY